MPLDLFCILEGTPLDATDRLLLFHPAGLALGNEPAFAPYGAQNTTFDDFLTKALEQGILGFAVA